MKRSGFRLQTSDIIIILIIGILLLGGLAVGFIISEKTSRTKEVTTISDTGELTDLTEKSGFSESNEDTDTSFNGVIEDLDSTVINETQESKTIPEESATTASATHTTTQRTTKVTSKDTTEYVLSSTSAPSSASTTKKTTGEKTSLTKYHERSTTERSTSSKSTTATSRNVTSTTTATSTTEEG